MTNYNIDNTNKDQLMRSFPHNNLNKLVRGLEGTMTCDRECQRRKKMLEYKRKWSQAVKEYNKLPNKIEGYERNYIILSKGESAYDNLKGEQYKKEVNEYKTTELKKLYEVKNQLDGLLIDKQTLENYKSQQLKIVNMLDKKNISLKKDIDNKKYSTLTNERRVYYENNGLKSLNNIRFYLYIKYWVVLPILFVTYLIVGPFFPKKEYKNYIRLSILLIVYILFAIPQVLFGISKILTITYYKVIRALDF